MKLLLALAINITLLALMFLYFANIYLGIAFGISLLGWFFYFLWKRQNLVERRVKERVKEQQIIMPVEHVMLRAIESSGYSQSSGMGYLVLTKTFLHFDFVLLELTLTVPVEDIKGADFIYRLKGVSPGRKMLQIKFVNEKREKDSIALHVKDLDTWKKTINRLRRHS